LSSSPSISLGAGYLLFNSRFKLYIVFKMLPPCYIILITFSGKNYFRVGREILSLDMSVELECPEYSGNRLTPKIRNYLAKVSHM
jgi:hypothetical protein